MSLTDTQTFQVATYDKLLAGDETELELERLARIRYLKTKMRPRLAAIIGDMPDNVADTLRSLILGDAISLGLVTDPEVLDTYKAYLKEMLDGYGGPEAILSILRDNTQAIAQYVVSGYFAAKQRIIESENLEEIRMIDIDEDPVNLGSSGVKLNADPVNPGSPDVKLNEEDHVY